FAEMAETWSEKDAGWWSPARNTSVLSFHSNGGTEFPSLAKDKGSIIDITEYIPEKDGHTFKGWFTDEKCRKKANDQIALKTNTALYAGWEIQERTLTFDAYGGSEIKPVTVKYGTEIDLGKYAPKKDGFVFTGWYTDAECTNKAEGSLILNKETVLYAGWDVQKCTLTFHTNGGTQISPVTVLYGNTVDLENFVPEKEGFSFTGWYTDPNCKYKADSQMTLTADQTLYAGWKSQEWSLTFNTNGGSEISPVTVFYGNTVNLSKYVTKKEGFVFTGWYTDAGCKTKADEQLTLHSDTALYAGWEVQKCSLTFLTNGGVEMDPLSVDYGSTVVLDNFIPVREGYNFIDWYTDSKCTNHAGHQIALKSDTTLYANWKLKRCKLFFNSNGGTEFDVLKFDWGSSVNLTKYVPEKEGSVFTGWYTDAACTIKADDQIILKEETTLHAGWKSQVSTLIFNSNGGPEVHSVTAGTGSMIDLSMYIPEREGHTFTGWYTDAKCKKKADTQIVLNDDLTLYAGWEIQDFTLTFDTNGASELKPVTDGYANVVDLSKYAPDKEGHTFTGWYTDPECTQKAADQFVLSSNETLYAGWQILEFTLTFNSNGGPEVHPITADYGSVVNLSLYIPNKDGYDFTGWYADSKCKNEADNLFTLQKDTTLHAGWEKTESKDASLSELGPIRTIRNFIRMTDKLIQLSRKWFPAVGQ
ncbi:MAG: InlB B-repeat-containing protein, partial [Erysipelotrichaceae bacterium]|nr:InlB B-repeat-containing protein [Erysipelotrichaceae bacterium]